MCERTVPSTFGSYHFCIRSSSSRELSVAMGRCGGMLAAWTTVLYMLMLHGASSVDVDDDLTTACLRLCSDKDASNTARDVDRCVVGCQRVVRLALHNRLRTQQNLAQQNRGENLIRNSRGGWLFPDLRKWQRRMLTSGIGSRSRSAGSYLRIGRDAARLGDAGDVERRRGRMRAAGRYLRIGRDGESAEPEMMASGAVHDGTADDVIDMLHLRKVNRDAPVEHDGLQQQRP